MPLTRNKKTGAVTGLDIEAGSVAAAELRVNGSIDVVAAGVQPLVPGAFLEGEVADPDAVAEALKQLFSRHKLSKRVRLGVGNQRVVVRLLRLPAIEDPKEMEAAVRFQAQEQIAMPIDQAVLAHQVVGGVPAEEGATPQLDVIAVAARRDMVASFLDPLRRAGLEPVGIDLSSFGMIRALAAAEAAEPGPDETILYCNLGDVMNLAVARRRACLFTRVSHAGLESIAAALSSSGQLSAEHATQWLSYVGLDAPLEELDGDPQILAEARRVLDQGAGELVDELRLSLDYYGAQEGSVPAGRIVLAGPGSAIGGLPERLEAGLGLPVAVARPAELAELGEELAARLTLPFGLALEN